MPELGLRALATAGTDEHVDVIGGGTAAFVRLVDAQRVDALENKQFGLLAHCATAGPENFAGALVIPVVDDVLQEIKSGYLAKATFWRSGFRSELGAKLGPLGQIGAEDALCRATSPVWLAEGYLCGF